MKAVVISGTEVVVKNDVAKPKLVENSALVKVKATAVNPTDWKHVAFKLGCDDAIVGCDLSGEIVELGPGVDSTKWKVGDQLAGLLRGCNQGEPGNGAFAEFARVDLAYSIKLENVKHADSAVLGAGEIRTYEAAASLPVTLFTACETLFGILGNKLNKTSAPQNNHPLVIWGGATSAGFHAIQLAKAFNCYTKIIAVASKKNEGILKSFGADEVFDYHDEDVIEQITKAHRDAYHVVDAACKSGTLIQCLKVAPGGEKPAIVANLIGRMEQDDCSELMKQKPNVKVDNVILFHVEGIDLEVAGYKLPANLRVRENAIEFAQVASRMIKEGTLRHIPLKISDGLESLPKLMGELEAGKVSGEKLVARL